MAKKKVEAEGKIRPGPKLWSLACCAVLIENGTAKFKLTAEFVVADTEAEALGRGYLTLRSTYPQHDGWQHGVTATWLDVDLEVQGEITKRKVNP